VKAAVIRSDGAGKRLSIEEVATPNVGERDILVRVLRAGICGSDLHGLLDANDTSRAPGLIMGHEIVGEVAEVGNLVPAASFGGRVFIDPQIHCGTCTACQSGWHSICERKQGLGSSRRGMIHGGFAEYVLVRQEQVVAVPEGVPLKLAALIEPLANGLHVRRRADPSPGDLVVVLGAGTLGLSIIQAFAAAGIERIVATDLSREKLGLAADLGASHTVDGAGAGLVDLVAELSDGAGADVVVEAVGVTTTYNQALSVVRRRGKVLFFGAVVPTIELELIPILHKELLLIGCTGFNEESKEAIDLIAHGAVDPTRLVTHEFSLEQAQEAMDTLADPASGAVKVLLRPGLEE